MEHLRAALFVYARDHGGHFPPHDFVEEIPEKLWESPDAQATRYIYLGGLSTNDAKAIIVCEPEKFGEERMVLVGDGRVTKMGARELDNILTRGGK